MSRIHVLPDNLANKIAAGEVVERPASVVKELVENALDAGATDILVEIERGGKGSIRITDNGCGLGRDDLLLALERHATSKITTADDLEAITTLGFRGEALPAIASVSRFTMASREPEALAGNEIYLEGGTIRNVTECGMAAGSVVTVRNLFYNTPARLKFLRSDETEAGHVGELVTRLALARPDVRFTYRRDDKVIFRLASATLLERIAPLLGRGVADSLHPVAMTLEEITVQGFVAPPDQGRSTSSWIYTYVNGRFVRDRVVQHAITDAYREVLERGRYPVAVLMIELPPDAFDVNVHPTKHEVRFRQQQKVHDAIRNAVASLLRRSPWLAEPMPKELVSDERGMSSSAAGRVAEVREALNRYVSRPERQEQQLPYGYPSPPFHSPTTPPPAESVAGKEGGFFSHLTAIGQLAAAYILCQDGEDLVIIDQHAAHERVAYEDLRRQFAAGGVESQGLLFAKTVELTLSETSAARVHNASLVRLGFHIEEFGGATFNLSSVPRLIAGGNYVGLLRQLLEDMADVSGEESFSRAVEGLMSTMACHSVVRGAHPLSPAEILALFRRLDETDFAAACPHGRPVVTRIRRLDLERMFGRQ
ncbi:MAG TPA: DNA mismatch repair endonuclease MutL [Geobacterales bacterium]|nr:DNA mismatch repair endonuclease MutL [Geobacterales bacterium]